MSQTVVVVQRFRARAVKVTQGGIRVAQSSQSKRWHAMRALAQLFKVTFVVPHSLILICVLAGGSPVFAEPVGTELISAGRYLAVAADCGSCHSSSKNQDYSGGEPLRSPVGTLYPPNITSDMDHGIGSWTRDDFAKALKQGVGKGGESLYPAMPYTSYSALSDADVDALWAFVHQIPAVSKQSRDNDLKFPFNIRSGLVVWKSVYFHPSMFTPVTDKSATWNRGAYLVTVLGHCGECHTPRGVGQNLEESSPLDGAKIDGWFAPNISGNQGSVLHKWSVSRLEIYLSTGKAGDNAQVVGPMREVIDNSLSRLTKADIHAMAIYLKEQQRFSKDRPIESKGRDDVRAGAQIYADQCASCHQLDGKGISGEVPSLVHNDVVTAREPYNLFMAVLQGFPQRDGHGAMASFAGQLNDDEIAGLANYVRQAWGNSAPANARAERVASWRGYATAPMTNEQALLCPNLSSEVLKPAAKMTPKQLAHAEQSLNGMQNVVHAYRLKRPNSSEAETIEALSTTYCRQLADEHVSVGQLSYRLASFAQLAARAYATLKHE